MVHNFFMKFGNTVKLLGWRSDSTIAIGWPEGLHQFLGWSTSHLEDLGSTIPSAGLPAALNSSVLWLWPTWVASWNQKWVAIAVQNCLEQQGDVQKHTHTLAGTSPPGTVQTPLSLQRHNRSGGVPVITIEATSLKRKLTDSGFLGGRKRSQSPG